MLMLQPSVQKAANIRHEVTVVSGLIIPKEILYNHTKRLSRTCFNVVYYITQVRWSFTSSRICGPFNIPTFSFSMQEIIYRCSQNTFHLSSMTLQAVSSNSGGNVIFSLSTKGSVMICVLQPPCFLSEATVFSPSVDLELYSPKDAKS